MDQIFLSIPVVRRYSAFFAGRGSKMVKTRRLSPKSIFDEDLLDFFRANNIKELFAIKIWGHIIRSNGLVSIQDIPELPKAAYTLLPLTYFLVYYVNLFCFSL